MRLTLSGPGGASHLYLFDYSQICIYLTSEKANCNMNPDRLAERGVKSVGQEVCTYFGQIYIFYDVFFYILSFKVSKYT